MKAVSAVLSKNQTKQIRPGQQSASQQRNQRKLPALVVPGKKIAMVPSRKARYRMMTPV
jgi:hypothetical protein